MTRRASSLVFVAWVVTSSSGMARAALPLPPPGWSEDPERATTLAKQLGELSHFDGRAAVVTIQVYRAPDKKTMLYVTRTRANVAEAERNAAANAELADLHATLARQRISPESSSRKSLDANVLEATLRWRDQHLAVAQRMVISADAQVVVAVRGECIVGHDAAPATMTACTAALARLEPEIEARRRVPLNLMPAAPAVTLDPPASSTATPSMSSAPDTIASPERPEKTPIWRAPQEDRADRRVVYLGIGLVILAAGFWWNRRRRAALERAELRDPGRAAPSATEPVIDVESTTIASQPTPQHDVTKDEP